MRCLCWREVLKVLGYASRIGPLPLGEDETKGLCHFREMPMEAPDPRGRLFRPLESRWKHPEALHVLGGRCE